MRAPGPASPSSLAAASTRARGDRKLVSAWADKVVKRLRRLGLDVDGFDVEGSRLVFVPDGRLGLTLGPASIEVGLALAPGHLDGPRAMLGDAVQALELTAALEALPEQFAIGAIGDAPLSAASRASSDDLRALLDRAERGGHDVWIGWTVPRDVAAQHAATLDEQLADAIVALGELLALLGRAPESPAHAPGRDRRSSRGARAGRDEDPSRGRPDRRSRRERAPAHEARGHARDHEDREAESEPDSRKDATPAHPSRLLPLRPRLHAGMLRPNGADPRAHVAIGPGARVRVLEGPFVGKMGLVQDLDGRGGARVMLGLLAVRIDVKDLAPTRDGGRRPVLSSSHRKPLPVRS